MVSFDRIIKLTNCKVKSRRIDFSGTKYGSLLNTQEKISNRLFNRYKAYLVTQPFERDCQVEERG